MSRPLERFPRRLSIGPARAVALGLIAVASVVVGSRVVRLAYLKTRLPERAFVAQQRELVAADPAVPLDPLLPSEASRLHSLALAAEARAGRPTTYDPSYVELEYPGGDVPDDRGVCTDLIVRSYRDVGFDLQQLVHEDMSRHFDAYPSRSLWGMGKPDWSIDHRRVPNLMVFFRRHGTVLAATGDARAYAPGDIIAWHLGGGMTHIGIVTSRRAPDAGRPMVAHHVGGPPRIDDALFHWEIIGHYRYYGD